ncbi:E3 UFM1-protein ligase [Trichinella pseudospiralis]
MTAIRPSGPIKQLVIGQRQGFESENVRSYVPIDPETQLLSMVRCWCRPSNGVQSTSTGYRKEPANQKQTTIEPDDDNDAQTSDPAVNVLLSWLTHLCSKEDRINVFINYARLEHAIQVKDSCPTLLSQLLSSCQVGSFAPVTVWCFCHKRTIWLTGCVEGQLEVHHWRESREKPAVANLDFKADPIKIDQGLARQVVSVHVDGQHRRTMKNC